VALKNTGHKATFLTWGVGYPAMVCVDCEQPRTNTSTAPPRGLLLTSKARRV
jgi:hypothetical protein